MRVSLPGMFANAERALQSSKDDYACMSAFSFGELVDNLRLLKDGKCTVDEFFACYVFDSGSADTKLADSVKKERYLCMRDDPAAHPTTRRD